MHITYDKLWSLLREKKLSKTDLCNLTGISSRTMAKLSKNQSVTTDTLLSICEVLKCDLADIAAVSIGEEIPSIYEAYRKWGVKTAENERFQTTEFCFRDIEFSLHILKRKANKHTTIHCAENGGVTLEQAYPVGISPLRETTTILHPGEIENNKVTILVITGAPGWITGLDQGVVHSSRYGCQKTGFYVMSESALKLFDFREIPKE